MLKSVQRDLKHLSKEGFPCKFYRKYSLIILSICSGVYI